ncbi:MAG TPA: protein-glutamate O-methyltransferase CheR [Trinickia sp.]|uniref:protein-glutamate O-methyltransferase CheR n=1 Tax=Trinickia sp. TaxID=2571163 RepID=UPI002C852473|nr:protein-glutamate O-methyltransferase CheR [Trinickia sp.]HTI19330.1 protein-glutamate O-methyltransferase CheR [Trinickia sp.]
MSTPVNSSLLDRFRAIIERRLGLQFDDTRQGWLEDLLRRRIESAHQAGELYLAQLEYGAAPDQLTALAQELTVPETYFFRSSDQLRALQEQVLPERLRAQAARRCVRILSAGCASGEEPYSIAMALYGLLPDASWQLSIHAVDVNPAMLEKARRGHYTAWSLRETPAAMRDRWFRPIGSKVALDDTIRAAVTFEERNLNADDANFWRSGSFDVVFCRNVLMYFAPQAAQAAVARIARSLTPGGVLFLGHAETLRNLSQDFHLRHTHGTFYYERKVAQQPDIGAQAQAHAPATAADPSALTARALDRGESWVEAIGEATARVRALTTQPRSGPRPDAAQNSHLGRALDLFRQERFADALGLVQALPSESTRDPDMLLLHAVLLVHRGQLKEAKETCHRLLSIDGLNAGAHYVLALCREGCGDYTGSADCDQVAVYLDPAFAMPRLHLGLLARRAGDRDAMRRELQQAMVLLQREDASRLLLFGGGFDRSALLGLCRTELRAIGGVS